MQKLLKIGIGTIGFQDDVTQITRPTLPSSGKLSNKEHWASLMWSINTAEAHGKNALEGLVLALTKIIQAECLGSLLLDGRMGKTGNYSISDLLWDVNLPIRNDGANMMSLLSACSAPPSISLAYGAVIPQAWEPRRMLRALENLGTGGKFGTWKNTPNLNAIAWMPWPLVWVDNGNHSTMAGILTYDGQLDPTKTFDARELLISVYTDGVNWLRVDNDAVIAEVNSLPMAGIFEIGRRLIKTAA